MTSDRRFEIGQINVESVLRNAFTSVELIEPALNFDFNRMSIFRHPPMLLFPRFKQSKQIAHSDVHFTQLSIGVWLESAVPDPKT